MGPGTIVGGKYRLIEQIGEGGMATVWRAEHTALARDVAVKFISVTGPSQSKYVERFLREAKLAASIRHRNVVDILDFGRSDEGLPYMVLELLQGESLADRLARGPRLTLDEIVNIVVLSLGGLSAVHNAGVVHRDLKPENIFLVTDEDGVFPKLLDFGVSKSVDPERTDRRGAPLTQEGVLVGTPHYMAPEQARGMKDIDRRADLWAMGVIFYEMLAGRLPYDTEHVGDLLLQIVTTDAPPLSFYRPELGTELDAVLAKALARDREQRFQDAKEMRAAVVGAAARLGDAAGVWGRITPGHGVDRPADLLTPITGVIELAAVQAAALRASQTAAAQPGSAAPPAAPGSADTETAPATALDDAAADAALAATLPAAAAGGALPISATPASRRDPTDDVQLVRNSTSLPPEPLEPQARGGGARWAAWLILALLVAAGAALAVDDELRARALAALGFAPPPGRVPGADGLHADGGAADGGAADGGARDGGTADTSAPGDMPVDPHGERPAAVGPADAGSALGSDPALADAGAAVTDAMATDATATDGDAGERGAGGDEDAGADGGGAPAIPPDAAAADAGAGARVVVPPRRVIKRRPAVRRPARRRPR